MKAMNTFSTKSSDSLLTPSEKYLFLASAHTGLSVAVSTGRISSPECALSSFSKIFFIFLNIIFVGT